MACYKFSHQLIRNFPKGICFCKRNLLIACKAGNLWPVKKPFGSRFSSSALLNKGFCHLSSSLDSYASEVPSATAPINVGRSLETAQVLLPNGGATYVQGVSNSADVKPSNGRVMLIDGTSVMYRATSSF